MAHAPLDSDIQDLKDEKRRAETRLRELRGKLEAAEAAKLDAERDVLKPLAIRAHDLLCQYNHTDGCGWGYESQGGQHNWQSHAHIRWLEKVVQWTDTPKFGDRLTPEKLGEILDIIEQGKKAHRDFLVIVRNM
jgi:hypothetical protein